MKPLDKGVRLPLDPLVQAEIGDHVYVSELILVCDGHLAAVGDQIDLPPLPSDLILISDSKSEHQVFDLPLIGSHESHLLEEFGVQRAEVVQTILLPDQPTQEEVRESGLKGDTLVHSLTQETPQEQVVVI